MDFHCKQMCLLRLLNPFTISYKYEKCVSIVNNCQRENISPSLKSYKINVLILPASYKLFNVTILFFFLNSTLRQSFFFSSIELNFVTKQIILGVIRCLNFISRLLQRDWIAKLIRSHLHLCYGYFSSGNNPNQSQSALASFNMLNCAFSIWRIANSNRYETRNSILRWTDS